jgi:phage terminase large subunit-like protein
VAKRWIRGQQDLWAIDDGCWFDEEAAEFVREFLETWCVQSVSEWEGKPLTLLPWQWEDVVAPLYGWKRPDGRRRFRSAYVQVAKKNGKSTLVSGLSLYHLLADGEGVPEIDLCACDQNQAGIIYREASRMVAASPTLAGRVEDTPSELRLVCPANSGKLEAMSRVSETKDGFNPSLVVFDELHRSKTDDLWRVFRYAGRARKNFLRMAITTAGTSDQIEKRSICWRQYQHSRDVAAGKTRDATHLVAIYEPATAEKANEVDVDDPAVWRAANPSLGHTIDLDTFGSDLAAAKQSPAELAEFKQLCLNLWVSSRARFLREDDWTRCGAERVELADFEGQACWAGLDLASTTDLAPLCLVFPHGEGLAAFWWVFCPRGGAEQRSRTDGVPYLQWADEGQLTLTEGDVIDYGWIRKVIAGDAESGDPGLAGRFRIQKLLVDRWNASQLVIDLREKDGLAVEFLGQGYASLSAPTKELERLVKSGRFYHGGNPIAAWQAGHAIVTKDPAGNIKLDKAKSSERIDLLAATVDALAGLQADGASADDEGSVYETRGVEWMG